MSSALDKAHEYLSSLLVFGVKLGLQNMKAICTLIGDPQKDMSFIHVAGTNGKGSTCSMLAASFKNCGLKTGFYSSPFLYRFTERWRINGFEVSEDEAGNAINRIAAIEAQLVEVTGVRPTYFEVLTAAALLLFQDADVDVIVWETGLGGRLDATNVVTPLLSIITNIDLDHTQYLGDTLEAIAYEKGGIIKAGVPFVCGAKQQNVIDYYSEVSNERGALSTLWPSFRVEGHQLDEYDGRVRRKISYESSKRQFSFLIDDVGLYQVDNAGVAVAALELLEENLDLDFDVAIAGLEKFKWPGRLEIRSNGLVLDGAHNPLGAQATLKSLQEIYPEKKFHFVCGILKDKEWQEVIDIFLPAAKTFFFVGLENERSSDSKDLQSYALRKGATVLGCGSVNEALGKIEKPEDTVVIGSLYLIGAFLAILNDKEALRIDSLA